LIEKTGAVVMRRKTFAAGDQIAALRITNVRSPIFEEGRISVFGRE